MHLNLPYTHLSNFIEDVCVCVCVLGRGGGRCVLACIFFYIQCNIQYKLTYDFPHNKFIVLHVRKLIK
jgi:hypothetical protein